MRQHCESPTMPWGQTNLRGCQFGARLTYNWSRGEGFHILTRSRKLVDSFEIARWPLTYFDIRAP